MQITIHAEIEIYKPPVIDSDTIGDYKAELDSALYNAALDHITSEYDGYQEIVIDSVQPEYDGIEEYSKILNEWADEYEKETKKTKSN